MSRRPHSTFKRHRRAGWTGVGGARSLGYDDNQAALLAASKAATPQIGVLQDIDVLAVKARGTAAPVRGAKPLRNLENISGVGWRAGSRSRRPLTGPT